jgi:hypothetical protein
MTAHNWIRTFAVQTLGLLHSSNPHQQFKDDRQKKSSLYAMPGHDGLRHKSSDLQAEASIRHSGTIHAQEYPQFRRDLLCRP